MDTGKEVQKTNDMVDLLNITESIILASTNNFFKSYYDENKKTLSDDNLDVNENLKTIFFFPSKYWDHYNENEFKNCSDMLICRDYKDLFKVDSNYEKQLDFLFGDNTGKTITIKIFTDFAINQLKSNSFFPSHLIDILITSLTIPFSEKDMQVKLRSIRKIINYFYKYNSKDKEILVPNDSPIKPPYSSF